MAKQPTKAGTTAKKTAAKPRAAAKTPKIVMTNKESLQQWCNSSGFRLTKYDPRTTRFQINVKNDRSLFVYMPLGLIKLYEISLDPGINDEIVLKGHLEKVTIELGGDNPETLTITPEET